MTIFGDSESKGGRWKKGEKESENLVMSKSHVIFAMQFKDEGFN